MHKLYAFLLLSLTAPALATPQIDKVVANQVFEVRLGSDLAPAKFNDRNDSIRRYMMFELGWILPGVRFTPDPGLAAGEYRISCNGKELAQYTMQADKLMAIGQETKLEAFTGTKVADPTYGMPGRWISPAEKSKAEEAGCMIFDPVSVWATQMTELIREKASECYSEDHLSAGLDNLRTDQPALVERFAGDPAARAKLLAVVRNLLEERVAVRDLEMLAELVLRTPQASAENLSEAARQRLAGAILKDCSSEGVVSVLEVGPKLEAALSKPAESAAVLAAVKKGVESMSDQGLQQVLVTSAESRRSLRRLAHPNHPNLIVLSRQELLPYYRCKSIGTVEL